MAYDEITYADKVENNGATPAGRFGADDLNEIKTVVNANGSNFDGRIDLLEAGGGGVNNLTSSGHVGDGTTVTFPLLFAPTTEVPQAFVVGIDGVLQSPIDAYTVSTTTDAITFSSAPPVNAEIVVSTANVLTGTDISASTITATGSTTTRKLVDRFADTVNVKDFGAVGDGVTDDTDKFNTLEGQITGQIVDLYGLTYNVSAYPTGNTYTNGSFIIGSDTYSAAQNKVTISATSDTGGIGAAYGGGVIPLETVSGRTTDETLLVLASQGCRSEFVRAVNVGSIYCHAKGNVSGNYSSRQSLALVPQSVNLASEECWVRGGFRGSNIASIFSGCENESNTNLSARGSYSTGRHSANIASSFCYTGRGGGATFSVTISGGSVTGLTVDNNGTGYSVSDPITFQARDSGGTGATAEVTSVDLDGGITAVSIINGGGTANGFDYDYGDLVDAKVDNNTGDYSSTIASDQTKNDGEYSFIAASQLTTIEGTSVQSAALASYDCTLSGDRALVMASSNSTASGELSSVISGNLSNATADGAVVFGRRTVNEVTRSIAFGDSPSGSADTANRKFHLYSNGNLEISGALSSGTTFTDYAEYFENEVHGTIPLGTLVTLSGRRVRIAQDGDNVVGVISATGCVVAGDSTFTWANRYLTGDFGELLYHNVPDEDYEGEGETPMVSVPIENPDYDSSVLNIPRSSRPDEWSAVGLLGQIHTRIDASVSPDDYISSSQGVGILSSEKTNVRCMEVKTPYDAEKGYGVALCLVVSN